MTIKLNNSSTLLHCNNWFKIKYTNEYLNDKHFKEILHNFNFLLCRKSFYIITSENNGDGELLGIALSKEEAQKMQGDFNFEKKQCFYSRVENEMFTNYRKNRDENNNQPDTH